MFVHKRLCKFIYVFKYCVTYVLQPANLSTENEPWQNFSQGIDVCWQMFHHKMIQNTCRLIEILSFDIVRILL